MIKSTDITWELRSLRDNITKLEEKFNTLIAERDNALIDETIGEIIEYPSTPNVTRWDSYKQQYVTIPKETALKNIAEWWTKCEAIASRNDEVRPKNVAIRDKIINTLLKIGLKQTESVLKSNRSSKRISVTSAWHTAVCAQIPTGGSIQPQEAIKAKLLAQIEKVEQEALAAQEAVERERKLELERKRSDIAFVKLCDACGIDPLTSEKYDILDNLLSRCKYLRLAHYMQENRNDWGDGPNLARQGLYGFTIESETDKDIYDEINGLIIDWDGDGRCFRDCVANYGVIFQMVDTKLMGLYTNYLEFAG